MLLSVVIPVYNEEGTIASVVERVRQSLAQQKIAAEIIVVNDGSKDKSSEAIAKIAGIRFVDCKINRGKGAAVKEGFAVAQGDICLIQDADLEYDPADYTAVIAPIVEGKAQATMGSRFVLERPKYFTGDRKSPYFTHYIGNQMIVWLTNFLYGQNATDYEGCYKAFRRELVQSIPIHSNGFEYDNELVCKILRRNIPIVEVPIRYEPRTYQSGKKIRWQHGVKMLWTIFKYRFID